MASKWMTQLLKHDCVVKRDYNPFAHVLRTGSPSFDYIYSNTHGLPLGYSEVLWGPPKGGKTIATNAKIGWLHQNDPEAIALKFNTEMREELQLSAQQMARFGIDPERYVAYNTNRAEDIFDFINGPVKAELQKGAPIKYIIIDSTSDIIGRRAANAETILTQQRGDDALTLQEGLKSIKSTLRAYKVACSLVAQARAEQDPIEIMRGNKLRMAGAFALQHFAEYFIYVEQVLGAKGKQDLSGAKFLDESKKDLMGHAEATAHKIRVIMKKSSAGVAGRAGEFTLDYYNGIISTHEEAFQLGVGQGIILKPSTVSYMVPDFPKAGENFTVKGKDNFVTALKDNTVLCAEVLKRVRAVDLDAMENGRPPISGIVEDEKMAEASALTVEVPAE